QPRPDVASQARAVRRALARACAWIGDPDFRYHPADPRRGCDRGDGGAERVCCARAVRPRLRARAGPRHQVGHRRRAAERSARAQRISGHRGIGFQERKHAMNATPVYDLLLQGGHVICPASGIDGVMDVAIAGGKIAQVSGNILPSSAKQVIDARGKLVLPGMIDTHAHIYRYVTGRFGLDADMVGVQSGVTARLARGGASCRPFRGFRHYAAEPAASRCLAFISAYLVGGLEGHFYPALYSPSGVDVAATVAAAKANRDMVKGVKAH